MKTILVLFRRSFQLHFLLTGVLPVMDGLWSCLVYIENLNACTTAYSVIVCLSLECSAQALSRSTVLQGMS